MESNSSSKCSICQRTFNFHLYPFEISSCNHIFCLECIQKTAVKNNNVFICAIDNTSCLNAFTEMKISKIYETFLEKTKKPDSLLKVFCNTHNEEKIKFKCILHETLLCSFCLWEHTDHKKDTGFYTRENIMQDIVTLEERLKEMKTKMEELLSKISEIRQSKRTFEKDLNMLFKQIVTFLKTPFCSVISNSKRYDEYPINFKMDSSYSSQLSSFQKSQTQTKELLENIDTSGIMEKSLSMKPLNPFPELSNIVVDSTGSKDFLVDMFYPRKITSIVLIHRASENNFTSASFHSKCDGKGPTLTIIKSENGNIFGGYSSSSWTSDQNGRYFSAPNSFLFSLGHKTKLDLQDKNSTVAIYCKSIYGPTFGGGHDLKVGDGCGNGSISNLGSTYLLPNSNIKFSSNEAQCYLAGSKNFKVLEYEVYSLTLKE